MKKYPHIKSKRGFVRERRKALTIIKKQLRDLERGCAIVEIYGDDRDLMMTAINNLHEAIRVIDRITKKLV